MVGCCAELARGFDACRLVRLGDRRRLFRDRLVCEVGALGRCWGLFARVLRASLGAGGVVVRESFPCEG